jgi:hypothetical protein
MLPHSTSSPIRTKIKGGLAIATLILLSPILIIVLMVYLLYTLIFHLAIWSRWWLRGKFILFVYSNSPIWKEYIESRILPKIEQRAIVLNWSERSRWAGQFSLAALTFQHYGGRRGFNPLAVVFRPFHRAKVFRFWQPFQDFKHGQSAAVYKMEAEFLDLVDSIPG